MNKNINEDISDFSNIANTISNISNFTNNVSYGKDFLESVVPLWTGLIIGILSGMGVFVANSKIKTIIQNQFQKFVVSRLRKDPELIQIINKYQEIRGNSQEENVRRNMLYNKANSRIMAIFQKSPMLSILNIPLDKKNNFLNTLNAEISSKKPPIQN